MWLREHGTAGYLMDVGDVCSYERIVAEMCNAPSRDYNLRLGKLPKAQAASATKAQEILLEMKKVSGWSPGSASQSMPWRYSTVQLRTMDQDSQITVVAIYASALLWQRALATAASSQVPSRGHDGWAVQCLVQTTSCNA
eukprot:Skav232052  [mRNA]  locus=scaffold1641:14027:24111:+ [translate_table: standard]